MNKKILVIGIKGMAGHVIFNFFREKGVYDVLGVARNVEENSAVINLDISDTTRLTTIIDQGNFDYVVNCIGILNKNAEDHPAKAIWFNSYFPHFLEEITRNTTSQVIHISTDCVFNGKKGRYKEGDDKDGIGFYAQSKALGEIINPKDLTIRTSIIGPELNVRGIGLFHWFMSQSGSANLSGYSQAFWSGVTTLELAKFVDHIIQNPLTGLVHLTNGEKIDKYSLLHLFNQVYRNSALNITANSTYSVDKSFVNSREDVVYVVPSYLEMLLEQKKMMNEEAALYTHYTIA